MKQFLTLALTCFPLLCFGAPTYTTYFNNTHTYTNATIAGTNFAGRGVFTNGLTAGASTFTGVVTLPNGSESAPGLAFAAASNTGWYAAAANALDATVSGTGAIRLTGTNVRLPSGAALGWGSGAINTASDVVLLRDAANTLALRNGANAQTFNIYNTYTDASNYERGFAKWSSSVFEIGTEAAGTGTARQLKLTSGSSGNSMIFRTAGTDRWVLNASGHILALTDNTYDIGASGATRPRHYFGAGNVWSGSGSGHIIEGRLQITSASDGVARLSNIAATDFNRLQFGGTSASFPALKRSSTEIQVRLADDSADAPLKSGQLSNTGIRVMTPSSLQTLAAANALLANATKVRVVGSGGAVTLTSTPTIADGSDGQYVMIQGTDDTNTLTVQDQGSLASSNLELGAASRTLGAGDVLVLTFDTTASVWYEVSFANN